MRSIPVIPIIVPISALNLLPRGLAAHEAGEEEGIDSDHLFAFADGTDIGEVGEKELESGSLFSFGKSSGRYLAFTQEETPAVVLSKGFKVFGSATFDYFDIHNVPGFDDRNGFAFAELAMTGRYQLMVRERSPIGVGLDLQVEPSWSTREDESGEQVTSFGSGFAALADYEIVKGKIISVINIEYEPEGTRSLGEWEKSSSLNFSGAVNWYALPPNLYVGVGVEHLETYEGLGLNNLAGQATFVGPQFCLHNKKQSLWIIGGWAFQVGGHANNSDAMSPSNFDLVNFERNMATVRVGFHF